MNELQIFNSPELGEIRTATLENEPMFCLSDVCRALEITNVGNVKQDNIIGKAWVLITSFSDIKLIE